MLKAQSFTELMQTLLLIMELLAKILSPIVSLQS